MPNTFHDAGKRRIALAAAFCGLFFLTACQSSLAPGEGAVASAAAVDHLAQIRSAHGLPALKRDPRLERAALKQSGYMAASGRMTHDTGWGKDFGARMEKEGIDGRAAENLAHGRMDLNRVFAMWMKSQAHRRNMLDPRVTHFGLASVRAAKGSDDRYWTLVLGD